jgi:L-fuculose-phosphate aldolase
MSTRSEAQLREDIVELGRRLWARGFVASNDGNISVRLEGDRILTTPTGVSKGFMTPDMMVVTDLAGRKISGERNASSELKMHLAVYELRPEARAVVHSHPPLATGFAVAGIALDKAVLAEVNCTLGSIPSADYATPSTDELPAAVAKYIKAHDGMLLASHGALTVGSDLFNAYYKMETIEHFAQISLVARTLGGERVLSRDEVHRLQGLRTMYGIAAPAPICTEAPVAAGGGETCQVVQAPVTDGTRLVPDAGFGQAPRGSASGGGSGPTGDGEIRLTYRQLAALIEDAVRTVGSGGTNG